LAEKLDWKGLSLFRHKTYAEKTNDEISGSHGSDHED
jgi:hypothetical protein